MEWKFKLVHAAVKWPDELEAIARNGVAVIPLYRVLSDLGHKKATGIRGGAGTDLSEIMEYFTQHADVLAEERG